MKNPAWLILLCSVGALSAEEQKVTSAGYFPEYAKLQLAGNIGFISLGLGKRFFDSRLETEIFYGYVPAGIGGTSINTYALKNNFRFARWSFYDRRVQLPLYAGAALFYVEDVEVNTITRDSVQVYDYPLNSVHLMPYVGVEFVYQNFRGDKKRGMGMYMEVGALDVYLEDYFSEQNDDQQHWTEIINISLGFRIEA